MKRVLACVVTAIAVVVGPVFADLAGIDVAPNPPIPIGIVATFAARLDANLPPVVGYRWYTKGKDCGKDWAEAGVAQKFTIPMSRIGELDVRCDGLHPAMGTPPKVPPPTVKTTAVNVAGKDCGKDWAEAGVAQKFTIPMSRIGELDVRCDGLHPAMGTPPKVPPPTVKTTAVNVAEPVFDDFDDVDNMGQPLPLANYPMPKAKFVTYTWAGEAGPYIDGIFEQRAFDWNGVAHTYPVARQGNLTVVEFPFRDRGNLFQQVANGQPFYEETTKTWVKLKNWCGQETEIGLLPRTATWYRVNATQWQVIVLE